MNDIRSFLDSLATLEGLRGDLSNSGSYFGVRSSDSTPEYAGKLAILVDVIACISDDDLTDCLLSSAYIPRAS